MSLALFKRDHFKHFDDVLNDNITPFFSSLVCPSFKVDVAEDGMAFFIEADMPGLNKKDIKVELEDDVLTINAKRTRSEDKKKSHFASIGFPGIQYYIIYEVGITLIGIMRIVPDSSYMP